MLSTEDTIVALATPRGRGGLAVVRLSGPSARGVAHRLMEGDVVLEPRRATRVRVVARRPEDPDRPVRDEAVAILFAAPASMTGEDVVELSLHGSQLVAEEVIAAACRGGARAAGPGEFSLRAFLNGRMDLTRAEAVQDLVSATTRRQARLAFDQLEGGLAGRLGEIEGTLFDLTARLEAAVDYPEDADTGEAWTGVQEQIEGVLARIGMLLQGARRGRWLREGASVAIVGRPNVGKSTLFNQLAGAERAIVTEVAGTTRDMVTEAVDIGGVRVTLADTAGLRTTSERVEEEGVRRAERAAVTADVSIVVLDGSVPLTPDDRRVLSLTEGRSRVVVVNKSDLPRAWAGPGWDGAEAFEIAAATGAGVDSVIRSIDRKLGDYGDNDLPGVSNARHIELLGQTTEHLQRALGLVTRGPDVPAELVLADIARARGALEEVTGKRSSEELLAAIFSKFCVGK